MCVVSVKGENYIEGPLHRNQSLLSSMGDRFMNRCQAFSVLCKLTVCCEVLSVPPFVAKVKERNMS